MLFWQGVRFLLVMGSFTWAFVTTVILAGAIIVLWNQAGYEPAVFRVGQVYYSDDYETGLSWGFDGWIHEEKERFFAPELVSEKKPSYLALEKLFPAGMKLPVWFNPKVDRTLFQGRTLSVLPYREDELFQRVQVQRILWWLTCCLLPFLLTLFFVTKVFKKGTGSNSTGT